MKVMINGDNIEGEKLANVMNTHFVNAGSYVTTNVSKPADAVRTVTMLHDSIFMRPTDPVEIENVIINIKNNVAPGIDELGAVDLLLISPVICDNLAYIANLVLTTGNFPQLLKIARVAALTIYPAITQYLYFQHNPKYLKTLFMTDLRRFLISTK